MALLALGAFLTVMLIVLLVAGVAVDRRLFIPVVRMALLTRDFHMFVPQFVACFIVIKTDVLPISIRVAVCASASRFPFVFVVLLMAAVTIRWRIAMLDLGFMAGLALNFLGIGMRASEGEICPFMIKCLFCDRRNVFSSALVLGVAFLAFTLLLESSV